MIEDDKILWYNIDILVISMNKNYGKFIKKLRKKKEITQDELALMMCRDRSIISKWENDKIVPSIDDIIQICKIFDITIEEFIAAEEYTKENKKEIHDTLEDFLLKQNKKTKKFKIISIILLSIMLLFAFAFFLLYFYQTYNSTRVYAVEGEEGNYKFNNGLLLITREQSYLTLGSIGNEIEQIQLYYLNEENKKNIIYNGDSKNIIIDFSGYNSSINYNNIENIINNIYLELYNNSNTINIKLNFKQLFSNNKIFFNDINKTVNFKGNDKKDDSIETRVKKDFMCKNNVCQKEIENIKIIYNLSEGVFYIFATDEYAEYYIKEKTFLYNGNDIVLSIVDNDIKCEDKCKIIEERYNYYMNLIKKYI